MTKYSCGEHSCGEEPIAIVRMGAHSLRFCKKHANDDCKNFVYAKKTMGEDCVEYLNNPENGGWSNEH